jgi:hypothetical protein
MFGKTTTLATAAFMVTAPVVACPAHVSVNVGPGYAVNVNVPKVWSPSNSYSYGYTAPSYGHGAHSGGIRVWSGGGYGKAYGHVGGHYGGGRGYGHGGGWRR